MDCRTVPSDARCSLTIAGSADEVERAAIQHAVDVHGESDGPELRDLVRDSLVEAPPAPSAEGAFVQLIEFDTDSIDEMLSHVHTWREEIGDAGTGRWAITGADRDRPGRYFTMVEFPSFAAAMANSEHPSTAALSEKMQKLATGAPTFRNIDVTRTWGPDTPA